MFHNEFHFSNLLCAASSWNVLIQFSLTHMLDSIFISISFFRLHVLRSGQDIWWRWKLIFSFSFPCILCSAYGLNIYLGDNDDGRSPISKCDSCHVNTNKNNKDTWDCPQDIMFWHRPKMNANRLQWNTVVIWLNSMDIGRSLINLSFYTMIIWIKWSNKQICENIDRVRVTLDIVL